MNKIFSSKPNGFVKVSTFSLTLLLLACQSPGLSPPSEFNGIFFPRQKAGVAVMDAQLFGRLIEVEGCLRIEDRISGIRYIAVWPFGYSLTVSDNAIEVIDEKGTSRVHVGQEIFVGGGEIHSLEHINLVNDQVKNELLSKCSGVYWFVGSGLRPDGL